MRYGLIFALLCVSATAASAFEVMTDVPYVEGGHWRQKLDVYLPNEAVRGEDPAPLLVWIHGGAWMHGSKTEGAGLGYLADRGIAVASIGYRLSTDAIFPAQIDDCVAAVRFLATHAAEHGLDGTRIVVAGQSAGGHLAALLGTSAGSLDPPLPVAGVIDFYGPTDLRAPALREDFVGPLAPAEAVALANLFGGSPQQKPRLAAAASPVTFATPDDCPFLIIHGDRDPVVPVVQSRRLEDALRRAAVPVELIVVPGGGHGGRGFFTEPLQRRMVGFIARATGAAE